MKHHTLEWALKYIEHLKLEANGYREYMATITY
jgi:hypothetical protein